jgi:hypothetical protein
MSPIAVDRARPLIEGKLIPYLYELIHDQASCLVSHFRALTGPVAARDFLRFLLDWQHVSADAVPHDRHRVRRSNDRSADRMLSAKPGRLPRLPGSVVRSLRFRRHGVSLLCFVRRGTRRLYRRDHRRRQSRRGWWAEFRRLPTGGLAVRRYRPGRDRVRRCPAATRRVIRQSGNRDRGSIFPHGDTRGVATAGY